MILSEQEKEAKRIRIMETCFAYYCKHGLNDTGMKALGEACGMNHSSFYNYFESLDELIVQATAHCMKKVAEELLAQAVSYCPADRPNAPETVIRFMKEMPEKIREKYGDSYRFAYQVYSSPKYLSYGMDFFKKTGERYAGYAQQLAPKAGIPPEIMKPVILSFARAATHYAMFGDADSLDLQITMLADLVRRSITTNRGERP